MILVSILGFFLIREAAYTYGVSGIAIWSLGQEDMRLWDSMPDQI